MTRRRPAHTTTPFFFLFESRRPFFLFNWLFDVLGCLGVIIPTRIIMNTNFPSTRYYISDVCAMLVCIIRGLIVAHCSLTTYYYPLLVLAIRRPCNYSSQSSSTALDPPLDLLVRRGYHQNLAYTSWWSTYIIGSESEIELSTQTRGNELIWT